MLFRSMISKKGEATPLENQVAAALEEIKGAATEDNKKVLEVLKITGAKEVSAEGIKVIIIEVPYKQIKAYQSVQVAILPELEKKLGNAQVVIVAKRRALPKTPEPGKRYKAIRGVGRTLKKVHEDFLDDVVFPTPIVSKRIHYGTNGKQTTYVALDPFYKTKVEDRLKGYTAAYAKLTGIKAVFEI